MTKTVVITKLAADQIQAGYVGVLFHYYHIVGKNKQYVTPHSSLIRTIDQLFETAIMQPSLDNTVYDKLLEKKSETRFFLIILNPCFCIRGSILSVELSLFRYGTADVINDYAV